MRTEVFAQSFLGQRDEILKIIDNLDQLGEKVGVGKRNVVKRIPTGQMIINVKAFKIPVLVNSLVYGHFRKSKARRSFEHAVLLLEKNIGTPEPIAFVEEKNGFGLRKSFYVCRHIDEDLSFRTMIEQPEYPDREEILRQFTRFTHHMHEHDVLFMDHSPGNTLIVKRGNGKYDFFLVDLNRMRLGVKMGFEMRMKNFARLSATEDMVKIISSEYAHITGLSKNEVGERMYYHTAANHRRRARQKLKNRFLGKYR